MPAAVRSDGTVGWVGEPPARGTASLLFNCLSTILICTWSALHLYVPHGIRSPTRLLARKLGYLAVALITPEWMTMCAYRDWEVARELTKEMRMELHKMQQNDPKDDKASQETPHGQEQPLWSLEQSFFVVMHGVVVRDKYQNGGILFPEFLPGLVRSGCINLDDINTHVIQDKSKSNSFNKAVASLQISWFLAQLVGRAVLHMPVCLLELFTLAYLGCAIAAYAFWWNKPFDVQYPLVIQGEPGRTREMQMVDLMTTNYSSRWQRIWRFARFNELIPGTFGSKPKRRRAILVGVLACSLLGACHLIGWNAHFPSDTERLLWRIGSICCIVLPALLCVQPGMIDWRPSLPYNKTSPEWSQTLAAIVILSVHTVVRLYLLFEAFYSLRVAPAGVYNTVPWAQYMPHI